MQTVTGTPKETGAGKVRKHIDRKIRTGKQGNRKIR